MKFIQYSFLILFMATFVCCKNNDEKFIKEWESRESITPHKDYIKIKPDHTFEFIGRACTASYNSYGKWKVENDTLILNSVPSKNCQFKNGFGNNSKVLKFGEEFERETTIKDCQPENESDYINFVNDKFYIKNDTLEYITNIKFPFNDRIAFFIKR